MSSLSLRLGRFAGVGTLATVVHVSAAFLANQSGAAAPMIANTVGFACAIAVTYLGNFYWTFPDGGSHIQSVQRFSVMAGLTLLWTSSVVYIANDVLGWPFIAALAIILTTAPPANFVLSQLWVFRQDRTGPGWSDLEVPAMAVLLAAAAWYYSGTMLNHDTSWYLIATPRWLDGAELYRDIVEINPPLSFYLTAPAVFLSRATGLTLDDAYVLQVIALSLVSLLWFRGLLQRVPLAESRRHIMLAAAFAALCLTPVVEFGQRDHLMVAFVLPYIGLMAFAPASGRLERCLIGAFALLGLALKPHFYALPLFMSVLMILRQGHVLAPFTAEHLVLGIGSVLYALAVWFFYPIYFTDIVSAGRLVYGSYGGSAVAILRVPGLLAVVALAALAPRLPKGLERDVAVTLFVVTLAFVVAYLAQFKGWHYHRIPIYSALCLWLAWLPVPLFDRDNLKDIGDVVVRTALLGMALTAIGLQLLSGPYHNDYAIRLPSQLKGASSFMAFTSNVAVTYPLANLTETEPTTRYSTLWLIPGAVSKLTSGEDLSDDHREALQQVLDRARQTTAEDFVKGRPDVVFVDVRETKPYFGGAPFDYVDFFRQDPGFRAAWQHYTLAGTEAGFEVWRRNQ
jgi:putative flippase GtrA